MKSGSNVTGTYKKVTKGAWKAKKNRRRGGVEVGKKEGQEGTREDENGGYVKAKIHNWHGRSM